MNKFFLLLALFFCGLLNGQVQWNNVDALFAPLPASVHIYKTTSLLDDGKPNIAYYIEADLKDKKLRFLTDTTYNRRQTPTQFYEKNNQPLVVVNTTFFSFTTNQSLNMVIRDGKMVGYNIHSIAGKGKDTLTYRHPLLGGIGITKNRKADIAWLYTDSSARWPVAFETVPPLIKDSSAYVSKARFGAGKKNKVINKWKMQSAVGGGPVLLQNGQISITNNEELKFAGKAIDDKHPRTAMGYTKDQKLIILVIEGRNKGIAEGATLTQEAQLLKDLNCVEALNLDGGGSSCMLVNGKETIKISDPAQRPVPAVFLIQFKSQN